MSATATVDVNHLINQRAIGRLQMLVVVFGFVIITIEGFDLAVMGFIVPVLKQQWHISNQALAPILAAAQIGLIIGSVCAGPLADRFGRKAVLLAAMAFFGVTTLLTATVTSLSGLMLLRFLTGFGVGSVVPNTATLVSEYVPERIRGFSVSFLICGVALASSCAGFLSAWVLPAFGWQSILVVGGLLPLLMLPVAWVQLPESIRFLVAKDAPAARIHGIVERMAPGVSSAQSVFTTSGEPPRQSATSTVFSRRYLFGSLMLWLTYFAALLCSNVLSNWLPTLIKENGYSLSYASSVAGTYHLGGVAGSLLIGWAMDRFGMNRVSALGYLLACGLCFALANVFHAATLMAVLAFMLGFCLLGAISGVNAVSTAFYPTQARATGSCWMHGAGRTGALLAIFAGSQMLALGWHAEQVFITLIAPALVAGAALLAMDRRAAREGLAPARA